MALTLSENGFAGVFLLHSGGTPQGAIRRRGVRRAYCRSSRTGSQIRTMDTIM